MDKLKEYIKLNVERLNTERINDQVWLNLNRSLIKHSIIKSNPINKQSWFKYFFKPVYRKWAFALIVVCIASSFVYRVRNSEEVGNLISFNIKKSDSLILDKLFTLEKQFDFELQNVQNHVSNVISFVGFTNKNSQALALEANLRQTREVFEISNYPLRKIKSESLFSQFTYWVFKKHIDLKQTTKVELINDIKVQLQKKGINNVSIQISEQNQDIKILPENPEVLNEQIHTPSQQMQDSLQNVKTISINEQNISHNKDSFTTRLEVDKGLSSFNWILHSWTSTDLTQEGYNRWIRISDTLFRSFLIQPAINKVSPSYYLYLKNNQIFLAKDDFVWSLKDKRDGQFKFISEEERFPKQVTWIINNQTWQFTLSRSWLKKGIPNKRKDEQEFYVEDSRKRELDHLLEKYKRTFSSLFR